MPAASLIRTTSSPAAGLFVVPLVTVPFRAAAANDDVAYVRKSNRAMTVWGRPLSAVRGPKGRAVRQPRAELRATDSPGRLSLRCSIHVRTLFKTRFLSDRQLSRIARF